MEQLLVMPFRPVAYAMCPPGPAVARPRTADLYVHDGARLRLSNRRAAAR